MATGVGLRIKNKRLELGWSQEELASRMGLKSKSTICKIERGEDNMTTTTVKQYADALGVTPGYLMGWEGEHKAEYEILKDAYVKNEKAKELYEQFESLTPDKQAVLLNYLEFLQSQS